MKRLSPFVIFAGLALAQNPVDRVITCTTTGSADTYVCTPTPALGAYATGQKLRINVNASNTGASTINISTLGAKSIVKVAGGITTALAANDLLTGQYAEMFYDGTNFQMLTMLGNAAAGGSSAACDPFTRSGVCFVDEMIMSSLSGAVLTTAAGTWDTGASGALAHTLIANMIGVVSPGTAYSANGKAELWRGFIGAGIPFGTDPSALTDTEVWFHIKPDSITSKKFFCGMVITGQTGTYTPTGTIRLKFDGTDVSTWKAETCNASTCSTSTTNLPTVTAAHWYWLKFRFGSSAGTVYFSAADGTGALSTETSLATNLPTGDYRVGCFGTNTTDGGFNMAVDKFMFLKTTAQ
jgi:hypothetical protein